MRSILNHYIRVICSFIALITLLSGCNKQDEWLDVKSKNSDVIISTIEDSQALMDNTIYMSQQYGHWGLMATDNLYVPFSTWESADINLRNIYSFNDIIFENVSASGYYRAWTNPFSRVAYANVALETLEKLERTAVNASAWDNVKGSALFFRAFAFFELLQHFAKAYDPQTAKTDSGIPLKLSSNVNEIVGRSSVEECYQKIISDLKEATALLPNSPQYQTRPSAPAGNALLGKVCLLMGNYDEAYQYADRSLKIYNFLFDFKTLDGSLAAPLPLYPNNREIIFYAVNDNLYPLEGDLFVDTLLYRSYPNNDLRKEILYNKISNSKIRFRGSYIGNNIYTFGGIGTNEVYLIRAEAATRLGNFEEGMNDLNYLLKKRWTDSNVTPYTANNADDALRIILEERRKELPFTGNIRWQDLRRLNKDPRFAKEVIHELNGKTYRLPANDPRYVFDIPSPEIQFTNIEQNIRK